MTENSKKAGPSYATDLLQRVKKASQSFVPAGTK